MFDMWLFILDFTLIPSVPWILGLALRILGPMAIENVTKNKKVFPVRAPSNVVLDPTRQIKRAPKNKKCFHDETCFERMGVFPVCAPIQCCGGKRGGWAWIKCWSIPQDTTLQHWRARGEKGTQIDFTTIQHWVHFNFGGNEAHWDQMHFLSRNFCRGWLVFSQPFMFVLLWSFGPQNGNLSFHLTLGQNGCLHQFAFFVN